MGGVNDVWVCAKCHNVFNGDTHWTMGGYCTTCAKKIEDTPSQFNSDNWKKYLIKLRDRDWTDVQLKCDRHNFERVPKSGSHLGISLWRCIYCDAITQAT